MSGLSDAMVRYAKIVELLSDLEHERWSGWTKWQFSICIHNQDGTVTIPSDLVQRWERQAATEYADLTEKEKDSDRKEAAKTVHLLVETGYLT